MPEIISRKDALARGLKRYFTGEPCKHGHVSERQHRNGKCMMCSRISARDRRRNGLDTNSKEAQRMRYHKNPERYRQIQRALRLKYPERYLEYRRQRMLKNGEKIRAQQRESDRRRSEKRAKQQRDYRVKASIALEILQRAGVQL